MNGSSNILVLGVTGQVGKRIATNLKKRKAITRMIGSSLCRPRAVPKFRVTPPGLRPD